MSETIVYITGSPSFKSAVVAQLASEWIASRPNVAREISSFSLHDAVPLEHFKAIIGTDRNLLFFSEVQVNRLHDQMDVVAKPPEKSVDIDTNAKGCGTTSNEKKNNK